MNNPALSSLFEAHPPGCDDQSFAKILNAHIFQKVKQKESLFYVYLLLCTSVWMMISMFGDANCWTKTKHLFLMMMMPPVNISQKYWVTLFTVRVLRWKFGLWSVYPRTRRKNKFYFVWMLVRFSRISPGWSSKPMEDPAEARGPQKWVDWPEGRVVPTVDKQKKRGHCSCWLVVFHDLRQITWAWHFFLMYVWRHRLSIS